MKMRQIHVAVLASMCVLVYGAENASGQTVGETAAQASTVSAPKNSPAKSKNTLQVQSSTKNHAPKKSKRASKKSPLPKGDLIDKIEVIIYGEEDVLLVTKSDFERMSIDGQPQTKEGILLQGLMFLDAQKFRMVPNDEAIASYLNNIQREHNMTREQLEQLFKSSGYTYEEAVEQLRKLQAVNSIVDFKIRSRLIVPEQDVITYYKAHPVKLEPTYSIQRAVVAVPTDEAAATQFKKDLEHWCATGEGSLFAPAWQDAFWIDKADLADDKKFITTMNVGSCAVSGEVSVGMELFKLVEKKDEREQPLEERYVEIVDILRRPKYEELFAEYKKQLFDSASIVYV